MNDLSFSAFLSLVRTYLKNVYIFCMTSYDNNIDSSCAAAHVENFDDRAISLSHHDYLLCRSKNLAETFYAPLPAPVEKHVHAFNRHLSDDGRLALTVLSSKPCDSTIRGKRVQSSAIRITYCLGKKVSFYASRVCTELLWLLHVGGKTTTATTT